MLKNVFTGFLIFCLLLLIIPKVYSEEKQPNIVFIFVDDMGYYDLSSYGATEVNTTRIDKLAEDGVLFTDYYAAAPICSPSRAGLLTGCYPRRVSNNIWVHRPDSDYGLNPDELTMAELFKQNGYKTACIGKWHLGFEGPLLPRQQGFDHYYGLLHNLDRLEAEHFDDKGGVPVICDGEVVERPADPSKLTRMYTDEAIKWIKSCVKGEKADLKQDSEPFFLYLPHTMLHSPLGVSEPFIGTSNWGEYGDAIQEMDYHTGRLVDALKDLGIDDNTIVIFASDNGRGPGRNPDQPIRGRKLTTLEGGLRVPCIVWGPQLGIQKGIKTNVMAVAMDWYPTLATFAGIKIPENIVMDGRDLSSLIKGETDKISFSPEISLNATVPLRRYWNPTREWRERIDREEYLNAFFYHGATGALAAVRSGKWKLQFNPELKLYNLEADPGERNPVEDKALMWKMRGLVALFQEEMRLCARPAGQLTPNSVRPGTSAGGMNPVLDQESINNILEKGDAINIKKGNELAEYLDLTFSINGDVSLKLDLYKPKNSDESLPAVVCIHGGGWSKGSRKGFGKMAKILANNGFVAVSIDYRLSGVAPFPAQIQDCKAAVRWLRLNAEKYGIDASRIGAIGHSAGGHLTALLATSDGCVELEVENENSVVSDRINAAVAMGAQTDFLSERTKEVSSSSERGEIWRQFLGGTQAEKPDLYRLASPLYHLDKNDPPIAFITGEFDDPSTHAYKFRVEAEKIGVVSQSAIIKDAPHFFIPDSEWFDLSMDWSISFLKDILK